MFQIGTWPFWAADHGGQLVSVGGVVDRVGGAGRLVTGGWREAHSRVVPFSSTVAMAWSPAVNGDPVDRSQPVSRAQPKPETW